MKDKLFKIKRKRTQLSIFVIAKQLTIYCRSCAQFKKSICV